ncbi:MAG: CDP-2,3-bis-(O-geranylgeranyl)-sn-glycerol synthase [Candidatus Diapherotrites archaeon]|nr:CDP-2,3-bis-(O-geranylgeranyl)-sn-glycerol synthase [Candidatus Diapherotrites archaeon]
MALVELLETAIIVALYLVPLYITNASALLFGGKHPLDFGKKLFGQPVFGKGKSIEGTFAGFAVGMASVLMLDFFFRQQTLLVHENFLLFGALLCAGALSGDIAASFVKRRFGMEKGRPVLLLDQLDFIAGGLAFTAWMRIPSIEEAVIIVVLTLAMHRLANYAAFKCKIKSVPW